MATLPTGARPLLSPHVHVPVGAGTGGSGVAPSQRVPPKVPAPSPGLLGSGMLGGGDGARAPPAGAFPSPPAQRRGQGSVISSEKANIY